MDLGFKSPMEHYGSQMDWFLGEFGYTHSCIKNVYTCENVKMRKWEGGRVELPPHIFRFWKWKFGRNGRPNDFQIHINKVKKVCFCWCVLFFVW